MSRLSQVEAAGFQRWRLQQPGPALSPGNRPAWCLCGQNPGHSALPQPVKGEVDGVPPSPHSPGPHFAGLSLSPYSCFFWVRPRILHTSQGQEVALKLGGWPGTCGWEATNHQQSGWLKAWAPWSACPPPYPCALQCRRHWPRVLLRT